jgi:hypothetical protein
MGVPTWAILELPLGSPGTKSHLDVGPMKRCKVYYKGEGGSFSQVQAVVSLVCLCCSWLVLAQKVLQLHTNHLVWVLCRPMWVNEVCQLFLVPSQRSNTPLYPSKCYELGSVPQLLLLPLFYTWTHIWVFQRVGSASMLHEFIVFFKEIVIIERLDSLGFIQKFLQLFIKSHMLLQIVHLCLLMVKLPLYLIFSLIYITNVCS